MSFERNKGPIYLRLNIYFFIVFENTIIVETLLTFWHEYVRVKLRSLVRSRALRDIFETGDKDIKKGRATSCPAGGHWRGINHPCEGLHFNAWGWISNARARASTEARLRARQPARLPMQPPSDFMQHARGVPAIGGAHPSLQMQRARIRQARAERRRRQRESSPRLTGSSFSFILLFFSFCSNVCHRISRRSIVVSSVVCNRNAR